MNWKAVVAAGLLALGAGSANAAVSFYSYGAGAPTLSLLTDFSGDTPGASPMSTSAYSFSSGAVVLDQAMAGSNGAEPAFSATTKDTGNFLSVLGGSTTTLTLVKPVSEIELYIGSLDTYNTLSFSDGSSYTGAVLGGYSGAANGNQTADNTNGIFDFTFSSPITSVTLASSSNSFEVASIYTAAGVPEPATWGMMLVGLFGLGAAMRYARRNQTANAVA